MRAHFFLLLLQAALLSSLRADASLASPENLLKDPAHDPIWTELFSRLAPSKNRYSLFEEQRQFPFRRTPFTLKGEIRISVDRGLSLHYMEPESRVMIVDAKGLLMRDDSGHQRPAPSDARAQAAVAALIDILRFDISSLEKSFAIYGRRESSHWSLVFVPRDGNLAATIGTLSVDGEESKLRTITIFKSANQHIDINISATREEVAFTPEELSRFFR